LEDIGVEGKTILNWIPKKENGKTWVGIIKLRTGENVRLL
jgi:hypothetical protein